MKLFVSLFFVAIAVISCSPTAPESDIARVWEVHNMATTASMIQSDSINDIAACEINLFVWVVSQGNGISRYNTQTGNWGYFVDENENLLNQQFYKIVSVPPYIFAAGENTVIKFRDIENVEVFINNAPEFTGLAFLDNNIYLSPIDGGIIRSPISSNSLDFSALDVYHENFVFTMIAAGFNRIWATTDTLGIFSLSNDLRTFQATPVVLADSQPTNTDTTDTTTTPADTLRRSEKIYSAHTGANGYIYFSLGSQMLYNNGTRFAFHPLGNLLQGTISFVTRDYNSMLWVLTEENGIFTHKRNWLHYSGEHIDDAKKFIVSPNNGSWIITRSRGVITDRTTQ